MDEIHKKVWEETKNKKYPLRLTFGQHPDFIEHFRQCELDFFAGNWEALKGEVVRIDKFYNPIHPDIYILPRNKHCTYLDELGDSIFAPYIVNLPFSSSSFYADIDENNIFHDLARNRAFHRLGQISQLGYLVPPKDKEAAKFQTLNYLPPSFSHTRWIHSLLTAYLAYVILLRAGFDRDEVNKIVLAIGSHDIAMPAGGDSIIRIDPENLSEEVNYSSVLEQSGLAALWSAKYGFELDEAQDWINGQGRWGKLLDVLDKISYTALDCYSVGLIRDGDVRDFCLKYPLVMDIWQDIKFTLDKSNIYFASSQRLYDFLLLRAYEHRELLYNPYSRALDFYLTKKVKPLYETHLITKKHLLDWHNFQLEDALHYFYPNQFKAIITPDNLTWRKFRTRDQQLKTAKCLRTRIDHLEHINGFNTGLNWPVENDGKIIPLIKAVSKKQAKLLERINQSTQGYFIYFSKHRNQKPTYD